MGDKEEGIIMDNNKEDKGMEWCACMGVRRVRDGVSDLCSRARVEGKLRGEIYELFEVRSFSEFKDECSDIAWGIGRIIAGMMGREYVRIPGDRGHYNKVVGRMKEYGCMRSRRFLVNGRCPSIVSKEGE